MAAIFGLPDAPTVLFIAALSIVVGYRILVDRSAAKQQNTQIEQQKDEIGNLRRAIRAQGERHHRDWDDLSTKFADLHEEYLEARSQKHKAANDVARMAVALYLVQRLAKECTCERAPLLPLIEIVDRLLEELETVPPRLTVEHREPAEPPEAP